MKKNHFILLVIGVISGLLFSLGMCMCLLTEWNSFTQGIILATIGGLILLTMGIILYVKKAKKKSPTNWKLIGKISYGIIASLIFGLGMCIIMVWNNLLFGILVGILGIVMLLFLIPMCIGLKK